MTTEHTGLVQPPKIDKNLPSTAAAYSRLYETVKLLRSENGCPWDKDQTPLSMRRDLIEETFEAVDAITQGDALHAKEELGDVMLNATLIAYMYEQEGSFTIADSLNELTDKLIRRHPHVFTQSEGQSCVTGQVTDSAAVLTQWDKIKEDIEGRKSEKTILDEVPQGFPPLLRAYKMGKKAAKKGFDWKTLEPVKAKVAEEMKEVQEAADSVQQAQCGNKAAPLTAHSSKKTDNAQLHLEEEFGDLMLAVINYMRHLGVDPETAMDKANRKFYRRFAYVEQHMKEENIPMDDSHLEDEERLWQAAKETGL